MYLTLVIAKMSTNTIAETLPSFYFLRSICMHLVGTACFMFLLLNLNQYMNHQITSNTTIAPKSFRYMQVVQQSHLMLPLLQSTTNFVKASSRIKTQASSGTLPCSLLSCNSNVRKDFKCPKLDGTVPVYLFPDNCNTSNRCKSPNWVGIVPVI